jgi:hypothetical protein
MTDLRVRLTKVLATQLAAERYCLADVVEAVITELDMGYPCTRDGCRVRKVLRQHQDKHDYCLRCGIPHPDSCKRGADT